MFISKCAQIGRVAAAVVLIAGIGACDDVSNLGPDNPEDVLQLLQEISLSEFEDFLTDGQARVEMHIDPESMVAREISVASQNEVAEHEEIEGRISAISYSGGASGSLTLTLGDLEIQFNGETAFLTKHEDGLPVEEFVARINGSLAEGANPAIRARRLAPAQPQDGADSDFSASELRLLAELGGANLEMNLQASHFVPNQSPPPDGWLQVLGLSIEVNATGGVTKIHVEGRDADGEEVEYEGHVESVNQGDGSFKLTNGTSVRLTDETTIKDGEGFLRSLGAVAEALSEGHTVVAYGEGVLEGVEPRRIVALHAAFKPREENVPVEDFEGLVASINVDAGSITLENGVVVNTNNETNIKDHEEFLPSLEAAAAALAAGEEVVAWGEGMVQGEEPLTILAFHVALLIREDPVPVEDFESTVMSVDLGAGSMTLENGIVVVLDNETTIKEGENCLPSLAAVAQALADGETVVTWGEGEVTGEGPLTLRAFWVKFQVQVVTADFEDTVVAVDTQEGTVTLENGTVVALTNETQIKETGDLHTLEAVADAIANGDTVRALGEGTVESDDPTTVIAATWIKFLLPGV